MACAAPASQTVTARLLSAEDPAVRFMARVHLSGADPGAPELEALRREVKESPRVRALLSEVGPEGRIPHHPYSRKFLGAHWVLTRLAEIGYPPHDPDLEPLIEQAASWAVSLGEQARVVDGRVRRCASQEGNALLYLLALSYPDSRCDLLAERLIAWQWPGGGWNCDQRPEAVHASFHESLIPLRALIACARVTGSPAAAEAARRAAEMLLERRLFRRKSDGRVIRPRWTLTCFPCYYHYSFLHGLRAMAEGGFISDPRCEEALDLLEAKRLPDGGLPCETSYYSTAECFRERGGRGRSLVSWGPEGPGVSNDFVTVLALFILRAAGRG